MQQQAFQRVQTISAHFHTSPLTNATFNSSSTTPLTSDCSCSFHANSAHSSAASSNIPVHPRQTTTNSTSSTSNSNNSNTSTTSTPAPAAASTPSPLSHLFANNRSWAAQVNREYPNFFSALSRQQKPKYLWIGCSDSRVPASELLGLMPGEVFVHRNIANCVLHADFNAHSVIQFAVDVLKVEHVIVCGHYQCGGIQAALTNMTVGLADHWIRHIKDIAVRHSDELTAIEDFQARWNRMAELNVIAQAENVCHSSTVQHAWARQQSVTVHGWVYGVHNGLLKDVLESPINSLEQVNKVFHLPIHPAVAVAGKKGEEKAEKVGESEPKRQSQ